jgi:hypothetical protein
LLLESVVCFDLNRWVRRVHFGFCFAYDNCLRYLIVVYFCVIMKMLDNDFVSSVDNIFSLCKVGFVIDRNLEKLFLSTWFFSFISFYKFDD